MEDEALEREASSRVALETALSLKQLQRALSEIEEFNLQQCTEHELCTTHVGFAQLETNLRALLNKTQQLQTWHFEKHLKQQNELGCKQLLLAEISILLVTPYIHRLLTKEDRESVGELDAEKLKQLSLEHIDPIYATQYDGVCFHELMQDIKKPCARFCWCFKPTRKVSFWHQAHARVLASKFLGVITCMEMILVLGPHAENEDLILERAVGLNSSLEVAGAVTKLVLYDEHTARENLGSFTSLILTANAVVDSGYNKPWLLQRLLHYACTGARLILPWNKREAELLGELCYCGTKEEIANKLYFARFVWNLPETPLVRTFYRLGLQRIKIDHEFYIPPNAMYLGGQDPVFARVIANHKMEKLPETTTEAKALVWRKRQNSFLFSPTRPLHTPLLGSTTSSSSMMMGNFATPQKNNNDLGKDVLLVHFHGGGFIALSSFSHENYTRIWARDVQGMTVLSADYRLAPDFKFPYAFNDAYRTYKYAVEHCEESFGFVPRKILIAGDSAGGNLACAVTVQAIADGFRIPDGVLLVYPVLDMQRTFSPSLLKSVNDRIVPFVFLECCMSAYLGDGEEAKRVCRDTRCSPALAPDSVLRRMPPTRIVVGDRDPLMDQSIRFAHHLARLNVDVQCKLFEGMPHGFCSFVWPVVGVPEVRACIDECTALLRELAQMETTSELNFI